MNWKNVAGFSVYVVTVGLVVFLLFALARETDRADALEAQLRIRRGGCVDVAEQLKRLASELDVSAQLTRLASELNGVAHDDARTVARSAEFRSSAGVR